MAASKYSTKPKAIRDWINLFANMDEQTYEFIKHKKNMNYTFEQRQTIVKEALSSTIEEAASRYGATVKSIRDWMISRSVMGDGFHGRSNGKRRSSKGKAPLNNDCFPALMEFYVSKKRELVTVTTTMLLYEYLQLNNISVGQSDAELKKYRKRILRWVNRENLECRRLCTKDVEVFTKRTEQEYESDSSSEISLDLLAS